jgi:oligopeptide/dipeptide ABC transporter ATP-binding protein
MRQRVVIAIALACRPKLLLADEPTTALDVTVQAQVLALLDELKKSHGMSIMFITHNLGVVAQVADRVAVMYAGEIVEEAPTGHFFANPAHPYSQALLAAMPRVDRSTDDLEPIPGSVPPITERPPGCRFLPRCRLVREICGIHPHLTHEAPGVAVRCAVRAREAVGT